MTDNRRLRGRADFIRVAKDEDYEVAYIARKYRLNKNAVWKVIDRVGNMRDKVYAELRKLVARKKRLQRS